MYIKRKFSFLLVQSVTGPFNDEDDPLLDQLIVVRTTFPFYGVPTSTLICAFANYTMSLLLIKEWAEMGERAARRCAVEKVEWSGNKKRRKEREGGLCDHSGKEEVAAQCSSTTSVP